MASLPLTQDSAKKKTIVVTGGAGYLGSILVPLLLEKGYSVRLVDRFYFGMDSIASIKDHPNLKLYPLDMFHHENVPELFQNVDTLIHLASISNDPSGDLDPNLTIQSNFLATVSLARRAKLQGVKKIIFISSCSVYGASGENFLDEKSEVGPVTLYALSKLQSEKELIPLADENLSLVIFRFATLFGYSPRMRLDLAVNTMAKRALQGKSILLNGDGKQYRPFLHVRDAAQSIITVLEQDTRAITDSIYNVGNEALNYTIADLAQEIVSFFPNSKLERIDSNKDSRSYRVRFGKFEKTFGFKPQYDIKYGLTEIKQAFERGDITNFDDEKYYNLEIMKKFLKDPVLTYSLASSPLWESKDLLTNHK